MAMAPGWVSSHGPFLQEFPLFWGGRWGLREVVVRQQFAWREDGEGLGEEVPSTLSLDGTSTGGSQTTDPRFSEQEPLTTISRTTRMPKWKCSLLSPVQLLRPHGL